MDIIAEKELEYLNNELHMRMEKEYSNGAVLVSFSLIYFATVIGILINLIESALSHRLITILLFGAISGISFFFPILLYYSTATRNRENLSAIFNIAAYKKKYYERFCFSEDEVSGGRWENFHKITMNNYFNKGSNEVFFLTELSFFLFVGSFVLTIYFSFMVIKNNGFSLSIMSMLGEILVYIICFIFSVKRIRQLYNIYSINNVADEVESIETYYDIQNKLINECQDQKQIINLVNDLKYKNEKFNTFLMIKHIPLHKARLLEKVFYVQAFRNISIELPSEETIADDKIIKYVSNLAKRKNMLSIYEFISTF